VGDGYCPLSYLKYFFVQYGERFDFGIHDGERFDFLVQQSFQIDFPVENREGFDFHIHDSPQGHFLRRDLQGIVEMHDEFPDGKPIGVSQQDQVSGHDLVGIRQIGPGNAPSLPGVREESAQEVISISGIAVFDRLDKKILVSRHLDPDDAPGSENFRDIGMLRVFQGEFSPKIRMDYQKIQASAHGFLLRFERFRDIE
jgi:hypothetical protein